MLNILIISDEARHIFSLFKTAGFSPDMENPSRTNPEQEATIPTPSDNYDIALDRKSTRLNSVTE
jgi:hypothetical protein